MDDKQEEQRTTEEYSDATKTDNDWGGYVFGSVLKYLGLGMLISLPSVGAKSDDPYLVGSLFALSAVGYVGGEFLQRSANLSANQNSSRPVEESKLEQDVKASIDED